MFGPSGTMPLRPLLHRRCGWPTRSMEQRDRVRSLERKEVMYAKRIAAAVAAMSVATALAVGLAPQSAQAATNSISLAGVSKTNAPDLKSKGTIKTPTIKTSGNVTVSSRSYVITKGKKTVAKISTQGKTYKLGASTARPGTDLSPVR